MTSSDRRNEDQMAAECSAGEDLSCDGLVGPTGEPSGCDPDDDGDGWTVGDGDCDDARADINPGVNAELDECLSRENLDCDDTLGQPTQMVYTYWFESTESSTASCGGAFVSPAATWATTGPADCPEGDPCDFAMTGVWDAEPFEVICEGDGKSNSLVIDEDLDGTVEEESFFRLGPNDACEGWGDAPEAGIGNGVTVILHRSMVITW